MRRVTTLALVGLMAQLVDGALGMGYGVTSTTLLLTVGFAPAAASASVHLAELGTTLVSGVSHASFGNVSWPVVRRLALPGAVGAFLGAVVLSGLSTEAARPWMAALLLGLGVFLLLRFAAGRQAAATRALSDGQTAALGLVAGFVDATGGGGWGPIATPTLLLTGRMSPRKVVGSVDTCEFLVSLAASAGFLVALGSQALSLPVVGALLAGGLVAAPVAAWLVRRLPAHLLGAAVGGLLVITNARVMLAEFGVAGIASTLTYAGLFAAWALALLAAARARPMLSDTPSEVDGGQWEVKATR